uniref:Swi3 domain-containing protein n=1 Tax=Macrostomum lignano TaxID=282301 RepID=A0A1I8H3A4_9PLAT
SLVAMDSAGDEHGPGASADEVTAMSVFDETTVDAAKNSEEAVLEPQTAPDDADMDVEPADDELEAEKEQHDTDEAANATAATDESLGDQLIEQTDQQPSPPATETETPEDHVESAVAAEEVTKQPFSTQQPPEDSSDEDEDEEDDVPGELPTIATQQSSASKLTAGAASPDSATNDEDDDDTKSDASEPVDEEDEETNRSESPTSARLENHRLTSFDKRQEKFSQMKAAVKTYDVNMEMVIGKWKRLREDFIKLRANSVLASGDDGSLMITRRMTEIGNMCSRTTNADYYIATLPESVQQIVKKMAAMPRDVFLEARRRDWTSYDWFMYAGRMARVLAQGCLVRRRLTIDALSNGRSLSEKDLLTNSVSKTLRDCLCFCPEYRTKEMRQK